MREEGSFVRQGFLFLVGWVRIECLKFSKKNDYLTEIFGGGVLRLYYVHIVYCRCLFLVPWGAVGVVL